MFCFYFLSSAKLFGQATSELSVLYSTDGGNDLFTYVLVIIIPLFILFSLVLLKNIKRCKVLESELVLLKSDQEDTESNTSAIIDHLPMAVVVLNEDNTIETMNKQFVVYFGYSPKEIRTFDEGWSVLVKDSKYRGAMRRRWDYVVSEVLKHGLDMEPMLVKFQNKAGKDIYSEVCFVPFRDKSLIVFYDITTRKIAERDLHESEALFAAFMENLPGSALLKNTEGQFLYINKSGVE